MRRLTSRAWLPFTLFAALVLSACAQRAYNQGNEQMDMGEPAEAIPYYAKAVAKDPDNADFQLALGEAYVRDGSYARGIEALSKAAELDPTLPTVLEQLAFAYGKLNRRAEAIEIYWRLYTQRQYSMIIFKKLRPLLEAEGRHNEVAEAALMASQQPHFEPSLLQELGQEYRRQGRLKEAERLFSRAVELEPGDAGQWRSLGEIRLELGDGPGAAEAYGIAYRRSPNDISAAIGSAAALRRMGELAQATAIYQRVVERSPELLEPRIALIELYLAQGKADQAEINAREAFIRSPRNLTIRALKGAAHLANGDWDKAIYSLSVAERSDTDSAPWMTRMLGEAYLGRGERATARRYFTRAIARDEHDGAAFLGLCRLDLDDGREESGMDQCQQAIRYAPELREQASLLMTDFYERNGRYKKALEVEEEAAESEPETRETVEISVARAPSTVARDVKKRRKKKPTAIKAKMEDLITLKELILATPEESRTAREWFDLGEVAYQLEELDLAERSLTKAYELEPGHPKYRMRVAELLLARGHFDVAVRHLKEAIRDNETDLSSRYLLVQAYLGRGSARDALNVLRELRELSPNDPRVYELIAEAYFGLGMQQEGERYQQLAISHRRKKR